MITFTISDKEEKRIKKWKNKHKRVCKQENRLYSYTFTPTPTGIGSIIEVKCSCGDSFDATDINSW
jgi:hypothetical protein